MDRGEGKGLGEVLHVAVVGCSGARWRVTARRGETRRSARYLHHSWQSVCVLCDVCLLLEA